MWQLSLVISLQLPFFVKLWRATKNVFVKCTAGLRADTKYLQDVKKYEVDPSLLQVGTAANAKLPAVTREAV